MPQVKKALRQAREQRVELKFSEARAKVLRMKVTMLEATIEFNALEQRRAEQKKKDAL